MRQLFIKNFFDLYSYEILFIYNFVNILKCHIINNQKQLSTLQYFTFTFLKACHTKNFVAHLHKK